MSASQRADKKKAKVVREEPVAVENKEVSLDDIFKEEKPLEPEKVERPEPVPVKAEKKATPKSPGIEVNIPVLLRYAARLKAGHFGAYGNGGNFANHLVKDAFKVDGKALSIEEASKLINTSLDVSS